MGTKISFPRYFAVFMLFFVLIFSCKEEPKDLRSTIAGFAPAEIMEGLSPARNPDAIFCRARLCGQIRNAVAIPPGGLVSMDARYASGDRVRFGYGVLDQAIGRVPGPVSIYLKERDERGLERTLWEASLDPVREPADRGWHEADVRLGGSHQRAGRLCFGTDSQQDWGPAIANPRVVSVRDISRQSVIFILIDACRADHLGCYGYFRDTSPHLDGIAHRGTRFETAITGSGFTLTSVASMFSGLYPWQHGVIFTKGLRYPAQIPDMIGLFKAGGFMTAGFSGTYFRFSVNGFDRGFDVFDEVCANSFFYESADCLIRRAMNWLSAHADEPFFLYLHLVDTHAPYYPPEPFQSRFRSAGLGFDHSAVEFGDAGRFGDGRRWYQVPLKPSEADLEYLKTLYDGEIAYADERIGQMLNSLRDRGLLDNIIVLVTADHGEAFYEHRNIEHRGSLYDEVLKVPLIFAGPGIPRGRVVHDQVRTIDFLPTLLDLAGIPVPAGIQGRSLVPLFKDQALSPEPALAFRCLSLKKEHYEYAFRDSREKLFLQMPVMRFELYDLLRDPDEEHDLSSADPQRTRDLFLRLDAMIKNRASGP